MNETVIADVIYCIRSEIERLTALLHSRTNESSSAGVVERDGANQYSSPSVLRLESSTSGSRKKPGDERDNLHAAISTPMVTSRVSNVLMHGFICV